MDLTKSVWMALKRQAPSKDTLDAALKAMSKEGADEEQKKRVLASARQNFPLLKDEVLNGILSKPEINFDFDLAVSELFAVNEKAMTLVAARIFSAIMELPEAERQAALDEASGDADAMIHLLCSRLSPDTLKKLPKHVALAIVNDHVIRIYRERNSGPSMSRKAVVEKPTGEKPIEESKDTVEKSADAPPEAKEASEKIAGTFELACPERVDQYNNVEVSIKATPVTALPSTAWVGVYKEGETNLRSYLNWYRIKELKSSFKAPAAYGSYLVKLVTSSYAELFSTTIQVGPTADVKAEQKDDKLVATYEVTSGNKYSSYWLGLYEKKTEAVSHKSYITYKTVSKPTGVVEFDMPRKIGSYEVRMFSYSYQLVSSSNSVLVKGEDSLDLRLEDKTITVGVKLLSRDPAKEPAWIGIYHANEDRHNYYRRSQWVYSHESEVSFKRLVHGGQYVARLFGRENELLASSNTITVDLEKMTTKADLLGVCPAKVSVIKCSRKDAGSQIDLALELGVKIEKKEISIVSVICQLESGKFEVTACDPVESKEELAVLCTAKFMKIEPTASIVLVVKDCRNKLYYIRADSKDQFEKL